MHLFRLKKQNSKKCIGHKPQVINMLQFRKTTLKILTEYLFNDLL